MLNSAKVMNAEFLSIMPDDKLSAAYILMAEFNIRHLPVLNKEAKLVGILSSRDFTNENLKKDINVSEVMNYPVFTVHESTPLPYVIDEMLSKKISAMMVESTEGEWKGIITTDDLMKAFIRYLKRDDELKEKPLSFYLPNILF